MYENKWNIDLEKEHNCQCPRCAKNGRDTSGNNLKVYGSDKGAFCFACSFTIPSAEHREAMGWDDNDEDEEEVSTQEKITKEEVAKLKSYTNAAGGGARGISDNSYKHYAVLTKYNPVTGQPEAHYYPYFEDGELTGFKVRQFPKSFTALGKFGSTSELFGLFRYKNSGSKTCHLTAGEVDCMSLRDALINYSKSKNTDYEEDPVVSMATGESGSAKQLKAHYEWFDRFDKIIYWADQDEAGKAAIEKIVKALPHGKVYIASFNAKDVNELLMKGRERDIISARFNAKKYVPKGIVGSSEMYEKIVQAAREPKVPFPPFMDELNGMTGGGMSLKTAVAISASTGLAKSTLINAAVYYWLFNSDYKIGAISMEQSADQYGELMLSTHCAKKIGRMVPMDKLVYLESEYVQQKQRELFYTEDGSDRWVVLDERDESIEALKAKILELIVSCGCQILVLDTLSDILDATSVEEQQDFTKWIKQVLNKYPVLFLLICHQRKSANGQKDGSKGAMGAESDVQGSSTIVKSVALNIMLSRNKLAEDPIERNTTIVALTKNRSGSETSNEACKIYYDPETHSLHKLETWLEQHPHNF